MSVPAKAFTQWLHSVAPGTSTAAVSRLSGIKRSTLAQQLVRGKVAVVTVVSISRAFDIDAVAALSGFDKYYDLASGLLPPTEAELVSQISDVDLLREIVARNAIVDPPEPAGKHILTPMPHKTSVRSWIDAIDVPGLRHTISRDLQMAPQNLSAQLSANRLAPEVAVQVARIAGVGLTGGLVVTGVLTPKEGGWPEDARGKALRALGDTDLVTLAAARLDALGKALRRTDQDNEQTNALWENLG
ncbi:hypothetical protein IV500_08325 [Paeniglutamicibacter antarcticus]|uniref:Uncharacterized protein n=1 Tax=Arthrobacter terrae TaxID=2935737 RepID=A0A931G7K3_9MICC|nr:hypothetical protein [Arthrobacter terrae]MBG0739394.1 hypothetical protein [Arthrobacter terrae]